MPILTAQNLMKSHGASVLLEGAELHLARGEKVGLVGRNGTGKSCGGARPTWRIWRRIRR